MCRAHGTECIFPAYGTAGVNKTPDSRRKRQTRLSSGASTPRRRGPMVVSKSQPTNETLTANTSTVPIRLGDASVTVADSSDMLQVPWTSPHQNIQQDDSPLALVSNDDQQHNLHIVGPAATSDNQVLSDYLSAMPGAIRGSSMVTAVPGNPSRPVLFTMVQKVPLGMGASRSPPAEKVHMIEKIIEPFGQDVVDV